ncbi:MAG TPA: SIMPL domain-containing protein, partial [Verrucomicrobiae bacterium]|nr:SIMPL domain-containing protein [Verrucomicrobiae bacterium]
MKLLEKIFISCFILFIFVLFYVSIPSICAQNVVLSDDKPTISVVGEAEKSIPVDQSKISLAVENTASDSGIARKNNAEKMNKIISILHTKGLTNKNMSTSNFEIRPNY